MSQRGRHHRSDLNDIARRAMREKGLDPDFPKDALAQLERIEAPAREKDPAIRDLRDLLWASIDNDDSRDLDQLSVAEELAGGSVKVLVAIADVDALVKKGTPLDSRAAQNTTSVYTAGGVFPMLPEKLSTDLTSLNQDEDRLSVVIEYVVNADGTLGDSNVTRSLVRNKAKLAYNSVDAWRDGRGEMPEAMARVPGSTRRSGLQEDVSQRLRRLRYAHGALDLQTIEARAVFDGDEIRDLTVDEAEPAEAAHRGLHDRGERRDGPLSRGSGLRRAAAHRALARKVAADRLRRRGARVLAASGAGFEGAGGVPRGTAEGRSAALPGPLPRHREAHGRRRVRRRAAGQGAGRPFRARRAGLHALHRAEPPLPGRDHAAPSRRRRSRAARHPIPCPS